MWQQFSISHFIYITQERLQWLIVPSQKLHLFDKLEFPPLICFDYICWDSPCLAKISSGQWLNGCHGSTYSAAKSTSLIWCTCKHPIWIRWHCPPDVSSVLTKVFHPAQLFPFVLLVLHNSNTYLLWDLKLKKSLCTYRKLGQFIVLPNRDFLGVFICSACNFKPRSTLDPVRDWVIWACDWKGYCTVFVFTVILNNVLLIQ